jgi:hypothetical protein
MRRLLRGHGQLGDKFCRLRRGRLKSAKPPWEHRAFVAASRILESRPIASATGDELTNARLSGLVGSATPARSRRCRAGRPIEGPAVYGAFRARGVVPSVRAEWLLSDHMAAFPGPLRVDGCAPCVHFAVLGRCQPPCLEA